MHLFRKYISNRGSALFMVISTMTALMVSCMAMYFSVVSSRSTQYAVFYQNQSKQVSTSINDAVIAGMMDNQLEQLTNAMVKLNEGEKISTGANGFAAFGAISGVDPDDDLGAYTMEITRLPNETVGGVEKMVFDFATTASVNGASTVYHTIIYYEASDKENPPAATQVFAATGYVPNDVFLDGGRFITDVFFDNEMTVVNAYGGKNLELWGNLSTGGSLLCHAYIIPSSTKSLTFAIRNTYTANFNGPVTFASGTEKSTVLIGGDAYLNCKNAGTGFENANVYILGDLHTKGTLSSNTNYFVDGNVYLEDGVWASMAHVYCNGVVDVSNNNGCSANDAEGINIWNNPKDYVGNTKKSWNDMAGTNGIMNVSEMIKMLDEKTATNVYYKWVINDSNPSKDKYVKELDENRSTVVRKKLHFSQNSDNPIPTIELRYSNSEKGCIIEDVTCDVGNTAFNHLALVIDTGEDEDNIYTIRVKPNRDFDHDNVNETFSWYPFDYNSSSTFMTILVKGRGSVVVDVPKGVTYQDMSFVKFMHYGWYLLGGANPDYKYGNESSAVYNSAKGYWESKVIYNTNGIDTGTSDKNFEKYIHRDCKAGDGCVYTETTSTNKCGSCEGKMKVVNCSVHGKLNEFCPTCQPEKKNNHAGDCANHVGRTEIDAYLATNSTMKTRMTGSDGKIIYPTTNIFLISCDESANIRLSIMSDGTNIIQNSFFGYVYAPYMTFKAYGNNAGGGMVRLMGGMTVSDYVIDDSMSMIACWPEKMPNDLMSDECKQNKLDGFDNKGWKIALKAH
ncbi:MAG: hypothetical protein K2N56_01110 [Oscillospiraceae bacterium]|nr:hypothetical protein [Oscillospiraceae bacterium]